MLKTVHGLTKNCECSYTSFFYNYMGFLGDKILLFSHTTGFLLFFKNLYFEYLNLS